MDNKPQMDFKTDIFTIFDMFIEEIEGLKQLNALRVESANLAAANGCRRNLSPAEFKRNGPKYVQSKGCSADSATTTKMARALSSPTRKGTVTASPR